MKNKYEIRGDVTVIYVKRKDGTIIETLIDTEDLEIIKDFPNTWLASVSHSGQFYIGAHKPKVNGKRGWIKLHRMITNAPTEKVVDHINHNTLDNRKSNLRVCDIAINNQNQRGARSDNKSSGVRGVHWSKERNKWIGKFAVSGKFYHVGAFDDIESATEAVKRARAKLMKGSQEALLINVPDSENVLFDPNKPAKTNKISGIRNVHYHKLTGMWQVSVSKKHFGLFDTLSEAEEIATLARQGLISPMKERSPNRNNTSGVRGVYWHKRDKKWYVAISVNGKRTTHGIFDTFEEAVTKATEVRNTLN